MVNNKHITKIVAVIVALTLCLCVAAMLFSNELSDIIGGQSVSMEYETALFNTDEPININIIMEDGEWENMLDNAMSEQYAQCDIEINGRTFYRVGIRPKGNTSLSSIAMDPDTDRYSLKLEFDQFVDGQTCFGLDKLILNNNYADATNMKEALIYDMYQYIGADASLYNYAKISVNGEYWGVYLALEAVEDSFLLRNYGTEDGELYKPDSMDMGDKDKERNGEKAGKPDSSGNNPENMSPPDGKMPENFAPPQQNGEMSENFTPPQTDGEETENTDAENDTDKSRKRPDFGGGFGGMGGKGANLNYSDDSLDSYSTIWDGAVTNTSKGDQRRVVTALKNISEGNNLEEYMDIDNLLKYMAVHIFSVNQDSLSGMMAHNYYLYEYEGRLNIFPWDYNLALGGMGGGPDATDTINSEIDMAFNGTKFFDTLLQNENYLSEYHAYMQKLVDGYINGGAFDEFYNRTRSQIDELVKTDPTAFFTYDEYIAAADMLYDVVKLRGESIQGQLDGTIPSTKEGQNENPSALIEDTSINLKVMGSMNMGGKPDDKNNGGAQKSPPDMNNDGEGRTPPNVPEQNDNPEEKQDKRDFENGEAPNMPFNNANSSGTNNNLITYGICFAVLAAGMIFALLFRRKSRRR